MKKLICGWLFALALAAALPLGAQWGFWNFGPGSFGDKHWQEPVANSAALPATGNLSGDVRMTLDDGALHYWDGNSWESLAGGSGGAPTGADYLVKTADGTLSAERVVTDTTTVTWDWATAGQAKASAVDVTCTNCLGGTEIDESALGEVPTAASATSATSATTATTATTANAGDSATSFFSSGTIEADRLPAVTGLASACTDAQVLGGNPAGTGVECQADNTGTDDQTATEVPYTPTTASDWVDPDPASAGEGLDDLAARLTTEEAKADDDLPDADEVVESMLKTVDAANDEECLTFESTVGDFEWQSCSTGIGGSTGATDGAILLANGTGGSTLKASANFTAPGSRLIANDWNGGYVFSGTTPTKLDGNNGLLLSNANVVKWSSTTNAEGAADVGIARSGAGVIKGTGGSTGTRFLQGGGTAVASAAAMPLPTGRVFHVTGTTAITSITSTNFQSGVCVTLIFDDVLTFTDGSNLKLAGDFTTSADDTISLCFDGSNWFETARSVN